MDDYEVERNPVNDRDLARSLRALSLIGYTLPELARWLGERYQLMRLDELYEFVVRALEQKI